METGAMSFNDSNASSRGRAQADAMHDHSSRRPQQLQEALHAPQSMLCPLETSPPSKCGFSTSNLVQRDGAFVLHVICGMG